MFPWMKPQDGAYEFGRAKRASHIPLSAQVVVKRAFNEALVNTSVAAAPYMMPEPVRQAQSQRGLPAPAVATLGAGLLGLHLAGDTPTMGNKLRRAINRTFGTELDTETRAEAVLEALR